MKRDAFLRILRQESKASDLDFRLDKVAGKGSHYRAHIGTKATTIQSGELTPLMMKRIRKQLGLD